MIQRDDSFAVMTRTQRSDRQRLRRQALAAQGLLQAQPFGRGRAGARRAITHLGYVQIDSISVIERAHHHVLQARVPGYTPSMIETLLQRGEIFEYWTHAAAFMPIEDFRYSLPYKQAIKAGQVHWYKQPDQRLMAELLARIRSDGPLRSRDLESDRGKSSGWWDWKPAKKALEQLYMQGDLMVSDRSGFQKTYDLTERVLPADVETTTPDHDECATHLIDQQLRCHGLMTLKGLTYLRRESELRKAVQAQIEARLAAGTLEGLQWSDGSVFLLQAGALDQRLPRCRNRLSILSPFDNSVIQRNRLKSLFGFDFQLECYVPQAKRQYGYFSLPLLYRDQFIGRMDCKAHRDDRVLEIRSLHLEPDFNPDEGFDSAMVEAIDKFCSFVNCDSVSLNDVHPRSHGARARAALEPLM